MSDPMKKQEAAIPVIEQLFRDCFRPLTVFAMHYVNDRSVAEDIVQDLFLYVYEKYTEKKEDVPVNYLYTLVRYRCLNYLAHLKTRQERRVDIEKSYSNPHDPLELIERIELEHSYLQAVESLPSKCRQVFRMNRFMGKTNQEISDELSLSKRTVESHISHALKIIREKLSEHLLSIIGIIVLMKIVFTYVGLISCY